MMDWSDRHYRYFMRQIAVPDPVGLDPVPLEIELHRGVVVYVPRGVKHKAKGKLTVLTVCVPRGVLGDIHELE